MKVYVVIAYDKYQDGDDVLVCGFTDVTYAYEYKNQLDEELKKLEDLEKLVFHEDDKRDILEARKSDFIKQYGFFPEDKSTWVEGIEIIK